MNKPKNGKHWLVLVVNPGSTSTKIALFKNEKCLAQETVRHSSEDIAKFKDLVSQAGMREESILKVLEQAGVKVEMIDAISARGGLVAPCPSGTYSVNETMLEELGSGKRGVHASNLGALIGAKIAQAANAPAFITDPVVVDELCDEARYSGIPDITRRSIWHALNQKEVARIVAKKLGKKYEQINLVIVHLGGGTSVAAHQRGKTIDVNNALDGDGPFSVERSGGLPVADAVRLSKKIGDEIFKKITGRGGVVAYLGTSDMFEVEKRFLAGDEPAVKVLSAMAYQVSKEIGACAAVLAGDVDAVVLSGGLARCKPLVDMIKRRVKFIAPVKIVPGELEMEALAAGVLRVMRGDEQPRTYRP